MFEKKNKIYVGNLAYSVTDEELKKFFEEKGVDIRTADVIKDKYSGRSKGFGFAELGSEDEIEKVIEILNGHELKGRGLRINRARMPSERFVNRERYSTFK
jgi:RNA recognition motif-containing protein